MGDWLKGEEGGGGGWTGCWFNGVAWQESRGGWVDTPMPTMIILSHLELSRKDLPKLNSSLLMEIVTIPVGQVNEF